MSSQSADRAATGSLPDRSGGIIRRESLVDKSTWQHHVRKLADVVIRICGALAAAGGIGAVTAANIILWRWAL